MTPPEPIALWEEAAQDLLAVLRDLAPQEWDRPTDLPGWRVREILAHLAHLESEVAGMEQPAGGRAEVEARRNQPMPTVVTEAGVVAREGRSPAELLEELETACARRAEVLEALDLSDPKAPAPGLPGQLGWDQRTLLRNRPIDFWVHEQDVRRATGRPMTTSGVGAAHVADVMAAAFPFSLRGLPARTTVTLEVTGPLGRTLAARVGEDGRAAPTAPEEGSDATLEVEDLAWLLLAGGRTGPDEAQVSVTGDEQVAARVVRQLNVTP